jgi:hypothetical protein
MDKYGRFEVGDRVRLKNPARFQHKAINGIANKDFWYEPHNVSIVKNYGEVRKTEYCQLQSIFVEGCPTSWADCHWELEVEFANTQELQETYEVD